MGERGTEVELLILVSFYLHDTDAVENINKPNSAIISGYHNDILIEKVYASDLSAS